MRVLFDHSTPAPLRRYLTSHLVTEAIELGWDRLGNGDLLTEGEAAGFDVFVTAEKNRYRQNLSGRKIAIVELSTTRWRLIRECVESILAAINASTPGSYIVVDLPLPPRKPFSRSRYFIVHEKCGNQSRVNNERKKAVTAADLRLNPRDDMAT